MDLGDDPGLAGAGDDPQASSSISAFKAVQPFERIAAPR